MKQRSLLLSGLLLLGLAAHGRTQLVALTGYNSVLQSSLNSQLTSTQSWYSRGTHVLGAVSAATLNVNLPGQVGSITGIYTQSDIYQWEVEYFGVEPPKDGLAVVLQVRGKTQVSGNLNAYGGAPVRTIKGTCLVNPLAAMTDHSHTGTATEFVTSTAQPSGFFDALPWIEEQPLPMDNVIFRRVGSRWLGTIRVGDLTKKVTLQGSSAAPAGGAAVGGTIQGKIQQEYRVVSVGGQVLSTGW